MKAIIGLLITALLATVPVLGLDQVPLGEYLPGAYEGYSMQGGEYYVVENLTGLYDGEYMKYVERGVMAAVSGIYTRDSSYYSVIIHQMESEADSKSIVEYFEETIYGGGPSKVDIGDGGFRYEQYEMNYLYFSEGFIFVRLEGSGDSIYNTMWDSANRVVQRIPFPSFTAALSILSLLVFVRSSRP